MLVYEHEMETYQERGADFIIGSVVDVTHCLPASAYHASY
jgi:hypothetical protein